jgi:hypothetical protein
VGLDTGGQHDSTSVEEAEEREGRTPLDRPPLAAIEARADTAVSIEREVVSGHAYAILAPETVVDGRCGLENPTNSSVNGVSDP